jgi:aryl-alcohol dehydrogenase-like predicted oxidoreductase
MTPNLKLNNGVEMPALGLGVFQTPPDATREAVRAALDAGYLPPYSILVRGIELDVLPTAARHGMGILTYSPLAGGWLSGRWSPEATPTSPARQRLVARFDMTLPENQRKLEATEVLGRLADEAGLSLIELAIAFVVNHPAVTSAIIGPRTIEQLDSQLPAAAVASTPLC